MSDGISDGLSGLPGLSKTVIRAEAVQHKQPDRTWYVFWETDSTYGMREDGLSREHAEDLARRLLSGEEKL